MKLKHKPSTEIPSLRNTKVSILQIHSDKLKSMLLLLSGCALFGLAHKILATSSVATMASNYSAGIYSMAFVTTPSEEVAKKIASGLVKNKLAACVNIIPKVTSIYEWEGKINEDSEILMMIKTRTSILEELIKFVRENHPYEVCEVISSPISQGNPPYLDWIGQIVPEKV